MRLNSFENLQDILLKGGIAPRHVKRYLRELDEHLADLTAAGREAGLDDADAAMRARAALGPDAELADAMLKQRDFRSISARFPWAVFLMLPPVAMVLGHALWVASVLALGAAGGLLLEAGQPHPPIPHWFQDIATVSGLAANLVISPAVAWTIVWVAQRQRLRLAWPFLTIALLIALGFQGVMAFKGTHWTIQLHTAFPLKLGPSGPDAIHGTTFIAQAFLLSLPAVWLLWWQRKNSVQT